MCHPLRPGTLELGGKRAVLPWRHPLRSDCLRSARRLNAMYGGTFTGRTPNLLPKPRRTCVMFLVAPYSRIIQVSCSTVKGEFLRLFALDDDMVIGGLLPSS